MRSRILVLSMITVFLLATTSSVANPGGEGDSDRDFTCGGSCHGDPSLSATSDAVIDVAAPSTAYAGTVSEVEVTVGGMALSKNRILGIFLLSSLDGNDDHPEESGWRIIQDPNGGSSNYVEVIVPESGSITVNWVMLAPTEVGTQNLFVAIHHGSASNPDDKAFLGSTRGNTVQVEPIPADYPTLAEDWIAPSERIAGDDSPIQISTINTDSLSVEWRLAGESQSHSATVNGGENEWDVSIPASLGDTRIEYRITASKGEFDNQMPWLSIETVPPYFDGTLMGARLQMFSSALIIIGAMMALQGILAPRGKRSELDHTEEVEKETAEAEQTLSETESEVSEVGENSEPEPMGDEYWSRLIPSEDNPGWLWDPIEEEWVADPNNPPGGDS